MISTDAVLPRRPVSGGPTHNERRALGPPARTFDKDLGDHKSRHRPFDPSSTDAAPGRDRVPVRRRATELMMHGFHTDSDGLHRRLHYRQIAVASPGPARGRGVVSGQRVLKNSSINFIYERQGCRFANRTVAVGSYRIMRPCGGHGICFER